MKVTIIGTGYVGLVTGVSLALNNNKVVCIGRQTKKIDEINEGHSPFFEPGLDELLTKAVNNKSLRGSDQLIENVKNSDVVLIAVGTPTVKNKIDLSQIEEVAKEIGKGIKLARKYIVVAVKSTVVPGTTEKIVLPLLEKYSGKKLGKDFGLSMNPEFLREGNAVEDSMDPDRIVIGQADKKSGSHLAKMYGNFTCPILYVPIKTAEMTKYASNALFATLISYSNEIARICETTKDVDVVDVWRGVHLDHRLSPSQSKIVIKNNRVVPGFVSYLFSGCGYGGSCFPKDTKALDAYALELGLEPGIISKVISINRTQPLRVVALVTSGLKKVKGTRIAILGLTFKENTDDMREAPSLPIITELIKQGAHVVCHDPVISVRKSSAVTDLGAILVDSAEEALKGSDAVIVLTGWAEYKKLTPSFFKKHMKNPLLIDGRRIYGKDMLESGIDYRGIGYNKK